MPNPDLSAEQVRDLRALAGLIIPPSEAYDVPGADDDNIFGDILRSLERDRDDICRALAHLVTHEHAVAPMIGASASVSGTMAAAIRFAFVKGSFLSFSRGNADAAARVPALSLLRALRDTRVLGFLAIWFGVNIVFGIGSVGVGAEDVSVAWQAHIGGFFAGLVLFSLFDPIPRDGRHAADASPSDLPDRG